MNPVGKQLGIMDMQSSVKPSGINHGLQRDEADFQTDDRSLLYFAITSFRVLHDF